MGCYSTFFLGPEGLVKDLLAGAPDFFLRISGSQSCRVHSMFCLSSLGHPFGIPCLSVQLSGSSFTTCEKVTIQRSQGAKQNDSRLLQDSLSWPPSCSYAAGSKYTSGKKLSYHFLTQNSKAKGIHFYLCNPSTFATWST